MSPMIPLYILAHKKLVPRSPRYLPTEVFIEANVFRHLYVRTQTLLVKTKFYTICFGFSDRRSSDTHT